MCTLVKKNQYLTVICVLPKWKQTNGMLCHEIACDCILFGRIAFWYACLILIAFLDDFNCVLSQIFTFSVLLVLFNCSSLLKRHSILCFVHKSSESSGESALMGRLVKAFTPH